MIKPEIMFSQLEDVLYGLDEDRAARLTEDARIDIAEMLVGLEMQLDMLDASAHAEFASRLDQIKATARAINIDWGSH